MSRRVSVALVASAVLVAGLAVGNVGSPINVAQAAKLTGVQRRFVSGAAVHAFAALQASGVIGGGEENGDDPPDGVRA